MLFVIRFCLCKFNFHSPNKLSTNMATKKKAAKKVVKKAAQKKAMPEVLLIPLSNMAGFVIL